MHRDTEKKLLRCTLNRLQRISVVLYVATQRNQVHLGQSQVGKVVRGGLEREREGGGGV
jgi:hypothetical protein